MLTKIISGGQTGADRALSIDLVYGKGCEMTSAPPINRVLRIILPLIAIIFVHANIIYAEPKTPVQIVKFFIAGYGTSQMDEIADYTTAKFRNNKPKSVWVVDTWRALNKLKYGHTNSKVVDSKIANDRAIVLVDSKITTAAAGAKQKEVFTLTKEGGRWLIDDLIVMDEEVDLDKLPL